MVEVVGNGRGGRKEVTQRCRGRRYRKMPGCGRRWSLELRLSPARS